MDLDTDTSQANEELVDEKSSTDHPTTHTDEKPKNPPDGDEIVNTGHYEIVVTHSGDKPYACRLCGKKFEDSVDCTIHEVVHGDGKQIYLDEMTHEETHKVRKCRFCENRYKTLYKLEIHERTHTGEKPYKCQVCDMAFVRSGPLYHHMEIHTAENSYKCQLCEKMFKSYSDLNSHLRIHEREKSYNRDLQSTEHVAHTRSSTGTGNKSFKCNLCGNVFRNVRVLNGHMRTHTGERPFKCSFCPRKFASADGRYQHMKVHTTKHELPYKCPYCKKRFSLVVDRNDHVKSHIEAKPQNVCNSSIYITQNAHCSDGTGLVSASNGESLERFSCSHCGWTFRFKYLLEKHEKIHENDGSKPYQCDNCKGYFASKVVLNVHYGICSERSKNVSKTSALPESEESRIPESEFSSTMSGPSDPEESEIKVFINPEWSPGTAQQDPDFDVSNDPGMKSPDKPKEETEVKYSDDPEFKPPVCAEEPSSGLITVADDYSCQSVTSQSMTSPSYSTSSGDKAMEYSAVGWSDEDGVDSLQSPDYCSVGQGQQYQSELRSDSTASTHPDNGTADSTAISHPENDTITVETCVICRQVFMDADALTNHLIFSHMEAN